LNVKAFLNTVSSHARNLPVVILYVTEGCNLKCVTCSYRKPMPGELSFEEIKDLSVQLTSAGLKHIVYSGGEPLLRRDFPEICGLFQRSNIKQTLLTNGLLLDKRIDELRECFTEIIVSIDGADAATHNAIRGVNSFDLILQGISKTLDTVNSSDTGVSIRTVLQKQNFRSLESFILMAKSAGVTRISFLAADVSSDAYGRDTRGIVSDESSIALNLTEVNELRGIIDALAEKYPNEFAEGFISESPAKLHHIADYYEALSGKASFPRNICNAPNVSLVITSTGDVHPCFFLPKFANTRLGNILTILNDPAIKRTREDVKLMKPERCQKCVCTLYTSPVNALKDNF
jgi:Fe-coproporphyrin III synthase